MKTYLVKSSLLLRIKMKYLGSMSVLEENFCFESLTIY